MITRVRDALGAIYELARLMVITRFRLRGRYWRWRMETAFGRGMPASKRELCKRLFEYAKWMRRMRRMGKG